MEYFSYIVTKSLGYYAVVQLASLLKKSKQKDEVSIYAICEWFKKNPTYFAHDIGLYCDTVLSKIDKKKALSIIF